MTHTDDENTERPGARHADGQTQGGKWLEKKVLIKYPDEAQLGRSRDDDGVLSPNFYVPGLKGVKGQVKIYDVDENEADSLINEHAWNRLERPPDSRASEPSIVTQVVVDALSRAIGRAVGRAVDRAVDEASLHAKTWWNGRKSKRKSVAPSQSRVRGLSAPAPTAPAGWYVDTCDATQLRYWDGAAWTNRFTPSFTATPAPVAPTSHAPATQPLEESRISMSSAEWQGLVLAWLKSGAIGEELWLLISNARIKDADAATLQSQCELEKLTARQGVDRIRMMLESNPSLRDEGALTEFMRLFGGGRNVDLEHPQLRNEAIKEVPRLTEGEEQRLPSGEVDGQGPA
ncbi:DUF2510 domain-containing protein [Streptomyces sp. NPDC052040]|uniref:DUF2510 domain-containing protein n=1 Tax=Streptomyces sp. NPDC052040 TaxID=3365682 RepID=UPI0037D6F1C5